MKKILITGASGYVGGQLEQYLSARYEVLTFSLLHSDLCALDLSEVSIVIHCAALVHKRAHDDYEAYKSINCDYPVELATRSAEAGVPHFIFVSSFAVYGSSVSFINDRTELNPDTNYGRSKLLAERRLLDLSRSVCMQISIMRPPMIYGPSAPGNIASLLTMAKMLPVLPFGGIRNKRSLLSIDNLKIYVDYLIVTGFQGVIVATDPRPVSTSELVGALPSWFGRKPILVSVPVLSILLKKYAFDLYAKLYGDLVAEPDNSLISETVLPLNDPALEFNKFLSDEAGQYSLQRLMRDKGEF